MQQAIFLFQCPLNGTFHSHKDKSLARLFSWASPSHGLKSSAGKVANKFCFDFLSPPQPIVSLDGIVSHIAIKALIG